MQGIVKGRRPVAREGLFHLYTRTGQRQKRNHSLRQLQFQPREFSAMTGGLM